MRVADIDSGPSTHRAQTRVCGYAGCHHGTREGKPFCSEHVGLNEHAQKVLAQIALREAEDARVTDVMTKVKDYNVRGITARSIVQNLAEHGVRTKERLCRELNLERPVLDGYAKALINRGLLHLGRTGRGSETLSLTPPD